MTETVAPSVSEIIIVALFVGAVLGGSVVLFLLKVFIPWRERRGNVSVQNFKDVQVRDGRRYILSSLHCVLCKQRLYIVEDRRRRQRQIGQQEEIEQEFACFNPTCGASNEKHRIFGSYPRELGPYYMRMRSEIPEVVEKTG